MNLPPLRSQVILALLALSLFSIYFISLDQDVLPYSIMSITQEDEAYYAALAIDQFNEQNNRSTDFSTDHSGYELYSYPLTIISLNTIGNSYYGLRVPVVLIGFVSLLLLGLTLTRLNSSRTGLIVAISAIVLLAVDFTFFNFARHSNPQVYSIFGNSLMVLALLWRAEINKPQAIIIGFLAVFIVLFIYPYNAFLSLAAGIYLLLYSIFKKKYFLPLWAISGGVAAIGLFSLLLAAFGESIFSFINALSAHGGGVSEKPALTLVGTTMNMIYSAAGILFTHLFQYNPLLLITFFCSLFLGGIILALKGLRNQLTSIQQRVIVVGFITMICAVLQGAFVHSYPFKKWISLVPILVPFIVIVLTFAVARLSHKPLRVTLITASILSFFIYLTVFRNLTEPVFWNHTWNYTPLPGWVKWISIFSGTLITLSIILYVLLKKLSLLKAVAIVQLALSISLVSYFNLLNASFKIRDAHIELNPLTKGKLAVNGFTHFHQFYTDLIPAYHHYRKRENPEYYNNLADSLHRAPEQCFDIYKILPGYEFNPQQVEHIQKPDEIEPGDKIDIQGYPMTVVKVYPFEEYFYVVLSNKPLDFRNEKIKSSHKPYIE
ncbi:hypothetical protein [Halocola ammonii]